MTLRRYLCVTWSIARWLYCNDACTKVRKKPNRKSLLLRVLLMLTRDLFALFVQQYKEDNFSTDTERRAGLSAIAELLVISKWLTGERA